MNQLDVYYRALLNYRALTAKDRDCSAFRKAVSQADPESERIRITRTICTVEQDWLDEIEKGLVFVEKAIKEERQFIYSNGEVEPIEKVKNISKESVRHLARHSNLITREQTGDDIIPDKLYHVERLNDYAVYENRFLYMLLCYLRDFVFIRYSKILELSNLYQGELNIDKQIVLGKQTITYRVVLHEERKDDPYLREHNSARASIERMDLILKTIMAFLATPLMEYAGKAPMLKPPITKTNVLKMDNNFKGAVALYDYIIAYDTDGYSKEERIVELSPFTNPLTDEISEACGMLSFLMYEYGLDLNESLKNNYELDEQKKKLREIAQRAEQLELLRNKLAHAEIPPEEYVLELEKQLKQMHGEQARIEPLREEIYQLKQREEETKLELAQQQLEIKKRDEQLDTIESEHSLRMAALKEECNERIYDCIVKHEGEVQELQASFDTRANELNAEITKTKELWREDVSAMREQLHQKDASYAELVEKFEALAEEKRLCEAKLKAARAANGEMTEDDSFTDKDRFDELEREFQAFERFYREQWNQAKKTIRKKTLSFENLKKKSKQDDQPQ